MTLDRTDRKLPDPLQKDGRITSFELSAKVAPSPGAWLRRVRALEVAACHATTGDMDCLLRVIVEDLAHFSRFVMDSLLKHPGVIDLKSSFVLDAVKETTALSLAHLRG